MIVFFTGACGVGKTTLVNYLEATLPSDEYAVYRSDDTPMPSTEEVERLFVNGWEGWQKANNRTWIDRLMPMQGTKTVFWDGQGNMDILELYLSDYRPEDYRIVLVECEVEEMFRRLVEERDQPELAHEQQASWRHFLHRQAIKKGVYILDSTHRTTAEMADALLAEIG